MQAAPQEPTQLDAHGGPRPHRAACYAMGTRFELLLACESETRALAAAEAALAVIEDCDGRYSRFRRDSLVSRINRAGAAEWVRVDPETFELLELCAQWNAETEGAFDVCVGATMDRLRAGPVLANDLSPIPGAGFVLHRESRSVRLNASSVALDLGAVAKGHALDLAASALRELGIESALLHGGTSSVITLGAPPGSERAWSVDLGIGFGGAKATLLRRALSISAARQNDAAGVGAAHVLDPRRGVALEGPWRAAVAHSSARAAEAYSTALLVLAARPGGVDRFLSINELPRGLECAIVDGSASVRFHAAQAFFALQPREPRIDQLQR